MTEAPTSPAFSHPPRPWLTPVAITVATTALVALLARLPDSVSATAVGFAFLAVTYFLVLRTDDSAKIASYGLSLAGLFDPAPLSAKRIAREVGVALFWALLLALVFFPPFWLGFLVWWHVETPFHLARLSSLAGDFSGQLLVIALPEEAFYRGYLQSALD
jgi:membrane protease YdiL (CAAX protease family)